MGVLEGKVAIVTGAGGGIGRAEALLFAQEGARVVVNDVGGRRDGREGSTAIADAVVAEIQAQGGEAVANHSSVATREGANSLVWTALNRFKRLDILVNNAGILRDRTLLNLSDEDWDQVLKVHLTGTFQCSQAVARAFKHQNQGGRIINTTSRSGLLGNFGQGNYSAAKAGIAGLTFTMAQEFRRFGVTVNAVAPVALTRMTEDLPAAQSMDVASAGPELIAPAALFLASEAAAEVTGKILGVEGRRLFEYRVIHNAGVTLSKDERWTPEKIRDRWSEICIPE